MHYNMLMEWIWSI